MEVAPDSMSSEVAPDSLRLMALPRPRLALCWERPGRRLAHACCSVAHGCCRRRRPLALLVRWLCWLGDIRSHDREVVDEKERCQDRAEHIGHASGKITNGKNGKKKASAQLHSSMHMHQAKSRTAKTAK
jgi:hypothetical protein